MSKVKKMRADQMAKQLSIPFQSFREQAQILGYKLYSGKSSLPIDEARALIESIRLVLPSTTSASSSSALVSPSHETVQTPAVSEHHSDNYVTLAHIAKLTAAAVESHQDSGTNPAFFLAEMMETGGDSGTVASFVSSHESVEVTVVEETQEAHASVVLQDVSQTTMLRSVVFRFEHRATRPGDRLFVVGDRDELGAWDPARGVELDPFAWPLWQASILLPQGETFSFKLVQKTRQGDLWERGFNREALCGEQGVVLEGSFR